MTRRGFTLIELLVSVLIVGVLLALLSPALASARQAAQRVACQANLRSLGQAFEMYLNAGDGLLPEAGAAASAEIGTLGPWDTLSPFLEAPLPSFTAGAADAQTGAPWACPADWEHALQTGFSYAYPPGNLFSVGFTRRDATSAFVSDGKGVLAIDVPAVHPGKDPATRNALRADGSAGRYTGVLMTVR